MIAEAQDGEKRTAGESVTGSASARGRGTGWRRYAKAVGRPIAILLSLQLMGGIILSPVRTFFPIYLRGLGYPVLLISALVTGKQIMGFLGAWAGGAMSDSLGRKQTLSLGLAGALLATLTFVIPSTLWIAPLWILSGFCGGLQTVGAQSYLLDNADHDRLGVLTAFYNWGMTLGGTLGSPLAGFLLDNWDFRTFGFTVTLFTLVPIAISLFALPRCKVQLAHAALPPKGLFGYGELVARRPIIALAFLRFFPTFYYGMALLLIPLILNDSGASAGTIALYAMASQATASLGQIIVGRAADRLGSKWPTLVVFTILIISIFGTAVFSSRLWGILAFAILGITAAWSLSTLMPSLVARAATIQERGRVLGWVHLWWNLGMILGSMAGGAAYTRGAGVPFFIAGFANLCAIVLAFLFFRMAPVVEVPQVREPTSQGAADV